MATAALVAAPCALAQVSSSADYHEQVNNIVQPEQYNQYPNQGGYPGQRGNAPSSTFSHIAVEAGGGFTAPVGSTGRTLTYGYNVTLGGGWNFSDRVGVLAEYQFNRTGIQQAVLNAVGEPGGNVHIWSLTLDPIVYYAKTSHFDGYLTGGGGFYRRLTSFTEPTTGYGTYCDYFYCYPYQYQTNVVVSHNSSNQGGANLGTGLAFHAFGSQRTKFYAEARYTWLDTPGHSTTFIPVTFGIRW